MRLYLATAVAQLAMALSQANPQAKQQIWTMSGNWREAGWRRESRAPGNHPIRMDFALSVPESGISAAEDVLRAISDPSSDKFGQHLSADEVSEMFAPSADVVRQTAQWLNSAGIPRSSMSVSSDGSHIYFNTTVERAERLIDATFHSYSKDNCVQRSAVRCRQGKAIQNAVNGNFQAAESKSQQPDCFKYMTPECYRSLYNMPSTNAVVSPSQNSLGIYQPAWYAMSLISPLPITNIQVGDQFLGSNLNTMPGAFRKEYCLTGLDPNFDPMYPNTRPGGHNSSDCGVYNPPSVISVSYVYNEATFSEGYLQRQCLKYLKLRMRGVSVISASRSYLNQLSLQSHLWNLSTAGHFNPRGRGFPDVSAVANDVVAYSNGKLWRVAGTSASAPVFESMVALINNARQAVGKSPVGSLNPFLYGVGEKALRDVKTGWNSGCGVTHAFAASDGWDLVTGLGTPDFSRLLELYMSLP
ncbi:Tripeptidyl-peptidase SED1 [Colletotrichum viniferum]|nr:Tripeptidyl-peptidase SED1 [Colletotrichum viniferum]